MTNFKLNLKGQFNNSQTAVNPDCQPTVNRQSRLMSVLCILALLTLGVGNAWGRTIYLNYDNINWYLNDNCAKVHAWGGSSTQDVVLSWIEGNIATCTINDDQTNICFYRYYSSSWHDQTVDCTISDNKNYWKISSSKDGEKYKIDTYDRYSRYGAVVGDFNSWNPDANPFGSGSTSTINVSLSSSNTSFKILYKEAYYGNTGTITNSVSNWVFETSKNNCTITPAFASSAQNYSFKWENSTKKISVTYPTSYTITYGVGTNKGCSSVSVSPSFTSGRLVVASESITFSKTATNSGYSWKGWYNAAGGSGTNWQSTDANYTSNSRTGNVNVYACYDLINYNITYNLNGGSGASNSTYNVTTSTITLPTAPTVNKTGYTFDGWYFESNFSGTRQTQITKGSTGDKAYYAKWNVIWYTITYELNGGSKEGIVPWNPDTYSVEQNVTINVAPTKEGYDFDGWYTNDALTTPAGSPYAISIGSTGNKTFYAKWTPKNYTVTLDVDEANKGDISGATLSQSVTYNSLTTTVPNLPHAANGYGLMGYYTEQNGNGTKVINADGTWIASVTDYTDADKKWIHDGDVTLYAYYRQAAITGFTFDAATVAPGETVGVRPTIDPTPEGTTFICWEIQYSNGNPLDPQPTDLAYTDGKLTFTAPETSGTYKVEATLHLGADCEGTVLSTAVQNFQVAGDHTVTVQYKCGNTTIAASTTVNGKPLEWSSAISAPEIFGYTFHHWLAGDGITLSENGTNAKTGARPDSSLVSPIYIKAIYDGKLTAVYNKKQYVYLDISKKFGTGVWDNPYVYFYKSSGYYGSSGAGATGDACVGKGAMTAVPGAEGIYYYDFSGVSNFGGKLAFTWGDHTGEPNFTNTDAIYRGDFNEGTPLFIPATEQTEETKGTGHYFNKGYWVNYVGEQTGYTLEIYNSDGSSRLKSIPFSSDDKRMSMVATSDLEANHEYKFQLKRDNGIYYGNSGTMNYSNHGQGTAWAFTNEPSFPGMCTINTTASGDYIFHLTYAKNGSGAFDLRINVDYPIKNGDYRVLYTDGTRTGYKPSAVVPQVNNGKDTVSFFIRPGNSPEMKIQKASVADDGTITWAEYPTAGTPTNQLTSERISSFIPQDSVYNICLKMDGTGAISVENVEGYTGNYYIRTDAANNKWDNYKSADHMMTYSEYSERNSDYTHYWMTHVWANANVKFVVANDYSPCISDTLVTSSYRGGDASHIYVNTPGHGDGDIKVEANIRFMWNRKNNAVYRAYLSGGKEDGSKFLVLRGTTDDNIKSQGGEVLTGESKDAPGNNHGAGAHCMQFTDDENWIYETTVQVLPSSYVKLYALFNGSNFYYKGEDNDTFDGNDGDSDGIPNAIQMITGDGSSYLTVRVIYDFKTDRLLAAYIPSGNITTEMDINADVMFIREHQEDIAQLTFTGDGKITEIKTAYAVMRFNKWTLNNKNKDTHAVLPSPLSRYERDVFYVSFPFDVNLNEVFGFGTYGVHWIMEYYDGEARAANGFWKDTPSYWRFITNRNGYVLKKNVGYILALDLDELGEESSVWANNNERAELFFPSSGTMPDIKSGTVTAELDEHTCTIVRNGSDRTKADSHWNIMGVPTYINTTNISYANIEWTNKIGPKFLYTWNSADNTLTPTTATGFTYHAMHAYTVQYCGNVTWTTSVSPSSIVARQKQEPSAYEWCLELQQNDQMTDRTYVRMSDEEEVTSGFEFGYDMSKSMNRDKANIYTFIGSETVAGNSLPLQTEQTTVVPVGVTIKNAGEYTFAMPEGTNGVGVTLVDTEANVRTSLSALDYTVSLEAGEYTGRFMLEISPIQNTPTDLGNVPSDQGQSTKAQKVLIDGILYIVKDGKMYDARGARVE